MDEQRLDLFAVVLNLRYSDEDIHDLIESILPICHEKGIGAVFSINDFDDDDRELWEIPEAVEFMKKLVNLGFMSILEVSSVSPDLVRKDIFKTDKLPGFGAIELWLCANNKMKRGSNGVSQEDLALFLKDLDISNQKIQPVSN